MAISLMGNYLYSIADEGVAVFSIDSDGDLTFINKVDIDGMRGCHLSTDKEGKYLYVAGYHDGKVTVVHTHRTDVWEVSWTGYSTEDWEVLRREISSPCKLCASYTGWKVSLCCGQRD